MYWTEDRKQRVVDYMSGMIFGYCLGMIVGVWILWIYLWPDVIPVDVD